MDEITLNGDVYIKMVPALATRYIVNEDCPEFAMTISGEEVSKEELEEMDIASLPLIIREFMEYGGIIKKETSFVNNHNGFYQIWQNGTRIFMINRKENEIQQYETLGEIISKYLNLWDYLNQAKFVGIYLMNPNHPMYEYLYTLNGINLLRDPASGEYLVVANGNPMLDDYFSDNIKTNLYDINTVYQEIIAQLIKRDSYNGRNRKR